MMGSPQSKMLYTAYKRFYDLLGGNHAAISIIGRYSIFIAYASRFKYSFKTLLNTVLQWLYDRNTATILSHLVTERTEISRL